MALFSTKELIDGIPAHERFAVPAFNVHDMEYTKGVIKAAEEMNSPVILMLGEPVLPFAGLDTLANIALFAAKESTVPVAVALDHGKKKDNILRCIELGICIMVDGSHLPFEENIAFTKNTAEMAHMAGLSVEGELGSLAGSEDGEEELSMKMTDPFKAAEYVEKTGIDILAVSIGNSHGLYKGIPKIDVDRLIEIRQRVNVPLVLHGGSDLPDEVSTRLIQEGITKFNIGTDLKIAFCKALKDVLQREPMPFQPQETMQYAIDAVCAVAKQKISLLGSTGKADLYGKSRVG